MKMNMYNNLESLLSIPFKLLGKRANRGIVQFLLRMPNSRISNMIVKVLLNNLEDEPIKTRDGYIAHFKQSGHSTSLRKEIIVGNHERPYLKMIKKLITNGDYVVDIGAHEGSFSLFMALIVGKDGMVFSIEPNKENIYFLKRNIQYNDANIQVIEKAASNEKKESDFIFDNGYGAWGSLSDYTYYNSWFKTKRTMKVQVDTLDNIFKDFDKRIKFLKVDTEGNELNVFLGAKEFLLEHRPIVCFEVNMLFWSYIDCSVDNLFKLFADYGYKLFVLKKDTLHEFRYLDNPLINMFAIPQSCIEELCENGIIVQ